MKPEPVLDAPAESDMTFFRKSLQGYCAARHGDFETVNLFVTLKRTVNELNGILEAAYPGPLRVTPGRINVLMTLDSKPDKRMPLSELGEHLVVTRANITGLIDGLVKDGLVRRIDHPEDRRMVLAELTEKGKKFINWFAPRHQALIKRLGSCLSSEEKAKIVGWLDCLREHVRTLSIQPLEPFVE
ncbi:MAG: MarR family transcriptional regulator [Candidatus Eremiobacteraeota bacterium]|nr:MarR family transcriptional regulator [Candidatus Eremiobacteraeota bacterium]